MFAVLNNTNAQHSYSFYFSSSLKLTQHPYYESTINFRRFKDFILYDVEKILGIHSKVELEEADGNHSDHIIFRQLRQTGTVELYERKLTC